jgi:hypothetical protein
MIAAFNFFLGLPIIAVGVFDQDVTRNYALNHPQVRRRNVLHIRDVLHKRAVSRVGICIVITASHCQNTKEVCGY